MRSTLACGLAFAICTTAARAEVYTANCHEFEISYDSDKRLFILDDGHERRAWPVVRAHRMMGGIMVTNKLDRGGTNVAMFGPDGSSALMTGSDGKSQSAKCDPARVTTPAASSARATANKIPPEYLGHWSLVDPKTQKCDPESGPAEVTRDNIQTYHEDFCKIVGVKEVKEAGDPRTEITCIAGGEGGPETKQRETWRIKDLFGKQLFIEQTPGGITFWQRCP